ncbi:MAG: hypothetical protein GX616_04165, partial [Planctomycetes bacterium]|nr:hypothetical protein [Planctomycetota bacterium]
MGHRPSAKRLVVLLLCALVIAISGSATANSAATARLRLTPAAPEIEVGDVVRLEVRAEDVANLYGYQVYLDYDPQL